jgi:hypothetical protein
MDQDKVEQEDWASKRAAELLLCAQEYPWCVDEGGTPTGEHYQGDTCAARYREMFAIELRAGRAQGRAEGREEQREADLEVVAEIRRVKRSLRRDRQTHHRGRGGE